MASALQFHHSAHASAAQMAIAAAKCGLELKALKKECGHGIWEEFFARNFAQHGMTIRTAQRYIGLADGLKGKALKNDTGSFLALLDSPPSKLTQAESQKLTKEMGKVTDGATLSELYQDFGIVKKPQGSGAKGGARVKGDEDGPQLSDEEILIEGRKVQTQQLIDMLTEGLSVQFWNVCDVGTRKKLHGALVDAQSLVKESL